MTFCNNCIYWEAKTDEEGLCRRHAPIRIRADILAPPPGDEADIDAVWPRTAGYDSCGDGVEVPFRGEAPA
jgi:hypothetical protein